MKAKVSLELNQLSSKDIFHLQKLFEFEDKIFSDNRASYNLMATNEEIIFEIKANDAVALRACLSAITKTLSIYERTKMKVEDQDE